MPRIFVRPLRHDGRAPILPRMGFRVALCCVLLVAGCSSGGSESTSSPAATASPSSASGRFLALVATAKYQDVLAGLGMSGPVMLSLARRECQAFAGVSGSARQQEMGYDLGRLYGWESVQTVAFAQAATATLCP